MAHAGEQKPFSHSGINNHNAALNRVRMKLNYSGESQIPSPHLARQRRKKRKQGLFVNAKQMNIYTVLHRCQLANLRKLASKPLTVNLADLQEKSRKHHTNMPADCKMSLLKFSVCDFASAIFTSKLGAKRHLCTAISPLLCAILMHDRLFTRNRDIGTDKAKCLGFK